MNDHKGVRRCKRPREGRSLLVLAALSFGLFAGSGALFNARAEDHSNSAVAEPSPISKWFANLHQHHATWGCCGAGPWYMNAKNDPVVYCFVPPEEQY